MTVTATRKYKIAVIPGDGIGLEVVPEGIRVLEAAAKRFGFSCTWQNFDWSCEVYRRTGRMMPENGLDQLRPFAAIFLGAVGHPDVPDHISLWGLLIPIRRRFRSRTGRMMPENGLDQLRPFAAIFLGAVGHPDVPDHISLWGLLIPIRRRF